MKLKRILIFFLVIISLLVFLILKEQNLQRGELGPKTIKFDLDSSSGPKLDIDIQKIIKLELNDSSLIGYTNTIKIYNGRIYILDRMYVNASTLLVFNEDGLFINKTKIGRGPGEILYPSAFTIDTEKDMILVRDISGWAIAYFDLDLNLINKRNIGPRVLIQDFEKLNNDGFLVRHRELKEKTPEGIEYYAYSLYDENLENENNFNIILRNNTPITNMGNPICCYKDEVWFISPYNYGVYQFEKNDFKKRYILDFGNYCFSKKELTTLSISDMEEQIRTENKIETLHSVVKTNDFLLISYYSLKYHTLLHSFRTERNYRLDVCIDDNLLPECSVWGTINDSTLYGVVKPKDLIRFRENSRLFGDINISESDNPYIILFEISNI